MSGGAYVAYKKCFHIEFLRKIGLPKDISFSEIISRFQAKNYEKSIKYLLFDFYYASVFLFHEPNRGSEMITPTTIIPAQTSIRLPQPMLVAAFAKMRFAAAAAM